MDWRRILNNEYLFYVFCSIFTVCGVVIIVIGGIALGNSDQLNGDATIVEGPQSIIAFGSIIFLFAFFSMWPVLPKHRCLMLLGVGTAAVTASGSDSMAATIIESVYSTIFAQYRNASIMAMPIDRVQSTLSCCGLNSTTEFLIDGGSIPGSCCGKFSVDTCTVEESFSVGCLDRFRDTLLQTTYAFGHVASYMGVCEFIGLILVVVMKELRGTNNP